MINRFLLFVLLALVLSSCGKDSVFKKYHDFDKNTWAKSEIVTFEPTIENTDQEYDISFGISHASAYPFANVIIGVTIETPAGEKRFMQHSLIIRNTDGTFKGDPLGEIYDISVPAYKNFVFKNSGKYKFIIENRMPLVEMPGLISIGLIINKSKSEEK